jgi:putative hydrolase of the HAD superfamily
LLIIFDLDDTLIDTTKKITPVMLKKAFDKLISLNIKIEDKDKAFNDLLCLDKTSFSSKKTLITFLDSLNINKKFYDCILNEMSLNLDDNIKNLNIKNSLKILSSLKKEYNLFLVTKGIKEFQLQKLKKAGLDTLFFSKIYITKKNKGFFFKKIIDNNNCSPKNVIVIGDKIESDLKPAKKLGCITIHMKYGKGFLLQDEEIVDYTINKLDDLNIILRKIGVKNDDK